MKRVLVGVVTIGGMLTGSSVFAGQSDDTQTRIGALEKENSAIRKEIALLRENKALLQQSAALKTSVDRPEPARSATKPAKRDVFSAYAADMPVAYKAPVAEQKGVLRLWGEGGAIWSGGDPITSDYSIRDFTGLGIFGGGPITNGVFDLTPKTGWEAAAGFDHRFADSPWHVSGQFRYGEGGKTSPSTATAGSITAEQLALLTGTPVTPGFAGAVIGGSETVAATNRETHWIADLAIGRDVLGSGPAAMQLKGGLRASEWIGRTSASDVINNFTNLATPLAILGPGTPLVSNISQTTSSLTDQRSSFFGVGPRIGIEGSVPFAGSWTFDYLGDAAVLFGNQRLTSRQTIATASTPAFIPGLGPSSFSTSTDQRFATVFNANLQVGASYWMTQNVKVSASYRLDAFFGVFNQTFGTGPQTTDRYIHGPRIAVSTQF